MARGCILMMTDKEVSKFLSLVLRHAPEKIDLPLDKQGWAETQVLLRRAKKAGKLFDETTLKRVVAENDKQRFTLSANGQRIRAAQGHSLKNIDLGLTPAQPPELLWHGTARDVLDAIFAQGLLPGRRQYVHLSKDQHTALSVGARHGKAVALGVEAGRMAQDGFVFLQADNGVWLTQQVPPSYLRW